MSAEQCCIVTVIKRVLSDMKLVLLEQSGPRLGQEAMGGGCESSPPSEKYRAGGVTLSAQHDPEV